MKPSMETISRDLAMMIISSLLFVTTQASVQENYQPQMVNLNIQLKGKGDSVKSDLNMPFYQSAEIEKKLDNRSYIFAVNPKKGKDSSEIELEIKLFNKAGTKVIAKKEIQAKLNQESYFSMKGLTFKFRPTI